MWPEASERGDPQKLLTLCRGRPAYLELCGVNETTPGWACSSRFFACLDPRRQSRDRPIWSIETQKRKGRLQFIFRPLASRLIGASWLWRWLLKPRDAENNSGRQVFMNMMFSVLCSWNFAGPRSGPHTAASLVDAARV